MKKFISIEEKANRYDKAIERAKKWFNPKEPDSYTCIVKSIFPEFNEPENESEEIRKWLIGYFQEYKKIGLDEYSNGLKPDDIITWLEKITIWDKKDEQILNAVISNIKNETYNYCGGYTSEYIIQWLESLKNKYIWTSSEKQGEQEEPQVYKTKNGEVIMYSESEGYKVVKPKFKVEQWVVEPRKGEPNGLWHIDRIEDGYYWSGKCGCTIEHADKNFHLWTIEDAKDGDILSYVTDDGDLWIMIYWSLYKPYKGHVHYHGLLVNNDFSDVGTCCIDIDNLKPATQEQRDLLFLKMEEADYEWNADKKELIKL